MPGDNRVGAKSPLQHARGQKNGEVIALKENIKALLIEDDNDICELVRIVLRAEDIELDTACDGETGLEKALHEGYDLIILDLMLPQVDGWEICRRLRQTPTTRRAPILMLTAKSEEQDKVLGLELGADDYVTKPFSPREFLARVKALLRRSADYNRPADTVQFGKLYLDAQGYEAFIGEEMIPFTKKEFQLLLVLGSKPGQTFKREQLMEEVWGFDYLGDSRTVDEHVKRIRQKLAEHDPHHTYIQTVWGVGYKFEVKDDVEQT